MRGGKQEEEKGQRLRVEEGDSEEGRESSFKQKDKKKKKSQKEEKVFFHLSKKALTKLVRIKAYNTIAALVSKKYYICAEDCDYVAGEQLTLATFFEMVRDRHNFIKIAKKVI